MGQKAISNCSIVHPLNATEASRSQVNTNTMSLSGSKYRKNMKTLRCAQVLTYEVILTLSQHNILNPNKILVKKKLSVPKQIIIV